MSSSLNSTIESWPDFILESFQRQDVGYDPNDPGLKYEIITTTVICLTLSTSLLLIRLFTRFYLMERSGVEDYLAILSWAFVVVVCALFSTSHTYGVGKHMWNITNLEGNLTPLLKINLVSLAILLLASMLVRIAIVTQYRSMFKPLSKRSFIWWSTWTLTLVFVIFYSIAAILIFFICSPPKKAWDPTVPGYCRDTFQYHIGIAAGWVNIISDLILLLMPQYKIWKLALPLQRRVGPSMVFLVGTVALAFSCVRQRNAYPLRRSLDSSYDAAKYQLWILGELTCGILCICLPVCPRFYKSVKSKLHTFLEARSLRRDSTLRPHVSEESRKTPMPESQERLELENLYLGRFDPERGSLGGENGSIGSSIAAGT